MFERSEFSPNCEFITSTKLSIQPLSLVFLLRNIICLLIWKITPQSSLSSRADIFRSKIVTTKLTVELYCHWVIRAMFERSEFSPNYEFITSTKLSIQPLSLVFLLRNIICLLIWKITPQSSLSSRADIFRSKIVTTKLTVELYCHWVIRAMFERSEFSPNYEFITSTKLSIQPLSLVFLLRNIICLLL